MSWRGLKATSISNEERNETCRKDRGGRRVDSAKAQVSKNVAGSGNPGRLEDWSTEEKRKGSYWEPNATSCTWDPARLGKMLRTMGPKKTPIARTLAIPHQQPLRDKGRR